MRTLFILSLSFFFFTLIGQNCGTVASSSFTETPQMDGSRDFEVTITFSTLLGGNSDAKDLRYTITCGANTYISTTCMTVNASTPPAVETFTIPAGDNCIPILSWEGRTSSNGNCNGTTCNGASSDVPLPVELMQFSATTLNNYILIKWETAYEEDNAGFEIERSKDGNNWQGLAFVKGQGTSLKNYLYKWVDETPSKVSNYYRLKQVDVDGKYKYSKITVASFNGEASTLTLAPNPTSGLLYYQIPEEVEIKQIILIDALGRSVFTTSDIDGSVSLNHLSSGLYTIIFEMDSGNFQVSKISKR